MSNKTCPVIWGGQLKGFFFKNKNDGERILPTETGHICYEVVVR